jgi:hypothetical protein
MNREDLVSLCEVFAGRRGLVHGRVRIDLDPMAVDPVPEILRSFRRAEISESEKNALLALVCDPDEEDVLDAETCVLDPFADQQTLSGDDD